MITIVFLDKGFMGVIYLSVPGVGVRGCVGAASVPPHPHTCYTDKVHT